VVLKVGFPKEGVFNTFLTMELVIDRFYLSPKPHQSGSLSHWVVYPSSIIRRNHKHAIHPSY
jgi:hypothetical protein